MAPNPPPNPRQTRTDGRESLLMPEKVLQRQIVALARLRGWWTYANPDSRRSAAGWPDLVLCRPPRLILAELKTERGRLRPMQSVVIDMLGACGVDVRVWRPSSWPEIEEALAND